MEKRLYRKMDVAIAHPIDLRCIVFSILTFLKQDAPLKCGSD